MRALLLGGLALLAWSVAFAAGIVIIVGAVKMMRLKSYNWALAASVLALLPCNPAGILGLATGIWGLVVLNRPAVKAAFRAAEDGGHVPAVAKSHRGLWWLVLPVICLACVAPVVAIPLLWVLSVSSKAVAPIPSPAEWDEPNSVAAEAGESTPVSTSGWVMGPDGPALTDVFARVVLQLQPAQIEDVNKILQATYQEYLTLEAQHTEQHTDDAGHIVVRINPFPAPIAKLEDRLWSELDAILDPQQQSIARLNLKLDPKAAVGTSSSEMAGPGFFGWGRDGANIELWRVGTWYHWTVQSRGYEDSSRAPQLPARYRRFWKESADNEATLPTSPQE